MALASGFVNTVTTISRRLPKTTGPALNSVVDTNTDNWGTTLLELKPPPDIVFSALGTTRAAAGGLANQGKIDRDLNINLVHAAKTAGTNTYVFISSGWTGGVLERWLTYLKMKAEVENTIKQAEFGTGIILKPGIILGQREVGRWAEGIAQNVVNGLGFMSPSLRDWLGQDAEVIARAAVKAAELAEKGKAPNQHWVLDGAEILRLGQTERK
ncbi:hypothetical protein CEP53_000442 [Fusarium sp. AF-6]|nr:hypothetical protein CEP53_000442 [Fusarium sp. AF-6]